MENPILQNIFVKFTLITTCTTSGKSTKEYLEPLSCTLLLSLRKKYGKILNANQSTLGLGQYHMLHLKLVRYHMHLIVIILVMGLVAMHLGLIANG